MTHYSQRSLDRLSTCHVDIRTIFHEVDANYAHTILEGKRTIERQRKNLAKGVSKTMDSRHLDEPSMAVDAAPDPLSWPKRDSPTIVKDTARYYYFAGYVLGVANQLLEAGVITHRLRWGGDWDGDRDIYDQNFDDLVHYELIP